MEYTVFSHVGDHYTRRVPRAISTPIYLDNVACHGTEDKLIDCTYHTDTSEDSHSDDIWIDCSNTSATNNFEAETNSNDGMALGNVSDTGLIVAIVALILSIFSHYCSGWLHCVHQAKKDTRNKVNIRDLCTLLSVPPPPPPPPQPLYPESSVKRQLKTRKSLEFLNHIDTNPLVAMSKTQMWLIMLIQLFMNQQLTQQLTSR